MMAKPEEVDRKKKEEKENLEDKNKDRDDIGRGTGKD